MPTLLYANNAAGTLAAPMTNVQTTLTLNPGQAALFPSPVAGQAFYVTLTDAATQSLIEIVLVTAVAGNVFTIVRGQDGTTGLSWNAGDIVSQRTIAAELRNFTVGQLFSVQVFGTPGTFTYTPTDGTNRALVRAIAGGGAGGSCTNTTGTTVSAALGGNAGAYGELWIPSGLSTQTVTVGAAGVPGGPGVVAGGSGGNTSFGTLMVCSGGAGGQGEVAASPPYIFQFGTTGAGVTGSGNIILATRGALGKPAIALAAASATALVGGSGADTQWGQGGLGAQGAQGTGFQAFGFGSGGGGAAASSNPVGFSGGPGAPGYLIVYEYQ